MIDDISEINVNTIPFDNLLDLIKKDPMILFSLNDLDEDRQLELMDFAKRPNVTLDDNFEMDMLSLIPKPSENVIFQFLKNHEDNIISFMHEYKFNASHISLPLNTLNSCKETIIYALLKISCSVIYSFEFSELASDFVKFLFEQNVDWPELTLISKYIQETLAVDE